MSQLSADTKHHILLEYTKHDPSHTFTALARRHAIKGGMRVIRRWHRQWDGTAASLVHKKGAGRPCILNRGEINRCIQAPILASNRSHTAVSYTQLLPEVQGKTGKHISLRTIQRIGKEQLRIKLKHTKKRTADECKCTHIHMNDNACISR
jgi:hypothetical protein